MGMATVETTCEAAAVPSAVGNVRQAEEQCKRTNELLDRFENLLREANLYSSVPNDTGRVDGVDAPDDLSLGRTAARVNNSIRCNANRLGDLLDVMQNELT